MLRPFYNWLRLKLQFLEEAYYFWLLLCRHNASVNTEASMKKMQYILLREAHVIEKGMSMRNPRKGFGQAKILIMLQNLNRYYDLYSTEDLDFLKFPISTVGSYIQYTNEMGIDITKIEQQYLNLVSRTGFQNLKRYSGIESIAKSDILKECNKTFESLLYSRHSIRYFDNKIPSKEMLEKALKLASRTPSACNRQGWLTHIFIGEKSYSLLQWQGGSNGFEKEIHCSILVTANLNAFLSYEVHQAYVDGGLYAMNLLNALHSLGLGTIPLSCGFGYSKLRMLKKQFYIPENEVPIMIIGVGELLDHFNVAISMRRDISTTNTYHY